ncbi:OsmC family protein [Oceanivirga miroungae]|uniref:OsmC family protein n=1 Tax=Oceanivirga miroungae TaxID=1130046 RepID=A0A6I8MBG8_9FUSO|nr:OsmC family protein [Oceanivirga miroungae]VWL84835.1 hypothetical protein OMES3154_00089 [Oceanivirga miroungae]
MYKSKTTVSEEFLVKSVIDGGEYKASLNRKESTTPMGILNVALSACIIMCVRGYYIKNRIKGVKIEIENEYEYTENKYDIEILVSKKIDEKEIQGIKEYIKEKCSVSKMLKEEIKLNIDIKGVE